MTKKILFLLVLNALLVEPISAFECTSQTTSGGSFDDPLSSFTPYDKIYVTFSCGNLEVGDYRMDANWVHGKEGIVRADSYQFRVEKKTDQKIYFWFKLSQKGPLESAFTNEDFYENHFGEWSVQGYLNDEPASVSEFMISY